MNEPTRLCEEPESELEHSLLRAGRSYAASPATRAKALSALGLAGVTATSTAAASTLTKAALVKVAVAVVLVGGAVFPAWRYLEQRAVSRAAPPSEVARAVLPAPAPRAAESAAAVVAASPPAPLAASGSLNSPTPPVGVRTEPKASSRPLSAELRALDAARASLQRGDSGVALAALDAYNHDFPHGKLGLEAEVLRIDALSKGGQSAAARQRADAFLRRHPDSVLASRVRGLVGL